MKESSDKKRKTIVISAVNLVEAGTLTILKDCLSYLSSLATDDPTYRVIAIVFDKKLAYFPNIEYLETQWPKKRWINRLWYEYVSLKAISKQIGTIDLWFSLHDTSPSVIAKRRAVYCHNTYAFYKRKMHDWLFSPKIAAFSVFTKYIYRTNIHQNNFLVVQQVWFREGMSEMFGFDKQRIIVAPPEQEKQIPIGNFEQSSDDLYRFVYAASPNSHKNFEVLCAAAEILEKVGVDNFEIRITVKGNENAYAKWLYKRWGHLKTINFGGFVDRKSLFDIYAISNCMIFPSKVESWGLPISEFALFNKPMLLADLPYTHETAAGSQSVAFFDPQNARSLASQMEQLIKGDTAFLKTVTNSPIEKPVAHSWGALFNTLLHD
ncbi:MULTISPECIES: glycosyltransferase [Sphingobacterium]|uniref:Glycosyltransferase n=1 Tax=Sphingobacterium populi TaxID=1812824 RepID=A0ABW5UCV3_9SPHI|nr:glycosyltransferase [Sphingobacterium sp. CFCC 11742]